MFTVFLGLIDAAVTMIYRNPPPYFIILDNLRNQKQTLRRGESELQNVIKYAIDGLTTSNHDTIYPDFFELIIKSKAAFPIVIN